MNKKKVISLLLRFLVQLQLPEKQFPPSHICTCKSREETTWIHRQLWEAALRIDLIYVVSRGTVLASLFPGPLKYRDFPSLRVPQPVPTWPPVILYQRGLSFLSNLSNISLWLGTLDTQVPCEASKRKKKGRCSGETVLSRVKAGYSMLAGGLIASTYDKVLGFSKIMAWQ